MTDALVMRLATLERLVADLAAGPSSAPELRRRHAVDGIRRSFLSPATPSGLRPIVRRAYLGLGRWRAGSPRSAPAPWGWRWLRAEHRHAAVCLPLWLYWPIAAWRDRWRGMVLLERLGFWRVREDGGWLWDGTWTLPRAIRAPIWCFLHDRDHYTPTGS